MGRKGIAIMAVVVLGVNLLVSIVIPRVAEGIIAGRLAEELSERFGAAVGVSVDVAHLGSLLQGSISSIELSADQYVTTTVDGDEVVLSAIEGELRLVTVDLGAALGGSLDEVGVRDGTVRASVAMSFVRELVREGIDGGGSFRFVSLDVDGSSFAITVEAPDGSQRMELVRPVVRGGDLGLVPSSARSDGDAVSVGVRDALTDLVIDLPELPLGIELREVVRVRSDDLVLGGRVPMVVDLS